ncbi:MAG: NAD-dependent epimerase/dehydratase family protein, partial [Rhodospirillaceae bacterium]
YTATKPAGELLCHAYHRLFGLAVVCPRLFTVSGPRQRRDLAILNYTRLMTEGRQVPFFGHGSSARDYTSIDDILDVVDGALRFVTTGDPAFEIVNLGESRTVSLARIVDLLGEKLGVTPEIQRLPLAGRRPPHLRRHVQGPAVVGVRAVHQL